MSSALQRDEGPGRIRGAASFEAMALRAAVRLPLDELLNAVEVARWPAEPRERLLYRLSRGESVPARTLQADDERVEIEIAGGRLRLPTDPRWPAPGRSFDLAAAVARSEQGTAAARAAGPLLPGAATTSEAFPGDSAASPATTGTLRFVRLAEVLEQVSARVPGSAAQTRETSAPAASRALLPAPPEDAAILAAALRQETAQSGLFYEAHLARWTRGAYLTGALREEPQARLAGAEGSAVLPVDPGGWPEELAALVSRQLETLDGGVIRGQTLPWPGQTCAWELWQENDPQTRKESRDGQPGWAARLRLELPRLGPVTVHIRLAGTEARLRIEAADSAAGVLREAAAACVDALHARGIASALIEVSEHGRR
jgi:hypothetical protein